ncbi:hypothetical protein ACTJLC_27425 [Paraburkholderia sp. 22099]|jgi:hypothetical protein|uniref:hypothetical protein n=1 Tax=Paraburkholderia TaxID=1822464 RepID=UPI0028573805|nr:hypothetical protein [Paraburkholderia terricola]MDR6448676.1 hypothetical protein [Paraburkholderia terricola]MDR6494083.1 hypothetical protein [Paraburkholderia terricola]
MPKRKAMIVGGLLVAALAIYGYHSMTTPAWQTISTTFMKNDKPYGGGDSRFRGNEVMSLKLAGPELRFRAVDLDKGYNEAKAVPEEAWMNNSSERLNRNTVSNANRDSAHEPRKPLAGKASTPLKLARADYCDWYRPSFTEECTDTTETGSYFGWIDQDTPWRGKRERPLGESEQTEIVVAVGNRVEHVPQRPPA